MCGISAVFASPGHESLMAVEAMSEKIRHRGPDDEGYVIFGDEEEGPKTFGGASTSPECYHLEAAFAPRGRFDRGAITEKSFLAFGHRRLSILDLSPAGHQPMSTADSRYWIIYNGEIYNFLELKEELRRLGSRFRSSGDTEVILEAYSYWGEDCVKRFNGMFAFVIYDVVAGTLFAARDRFGIKPLYYWFSRSGFLAIDQYGPTGVKKKRSVLSLGSGC